MGLRLMEDRAEDEMEKTAVQEEMASRGRGAAEEEMASMMTEIKMLRARDEMWRAQVSRSLHVLFLTFSRLLHPVHE